MRTSLVLLVAAFAGLSVSVMFIVSSPERLLIDMLSRLPLLSQLRGEA